jgi:phage gpG-like protein
MAEAISVSISGREEVNSFLRKVINDLGDMTDANKELSSKLAREASALAPKLTGRLASSIKGEVVGKAAQISANTIYAGVIEYGWAQRNIAAQPYLSKAVTGTNLPTLVYEEYIRQVIKKYNLD